MERVVKIIGLREEQSDFSYWLSKSPEERLAAIETLRQQYVRLKRLEPRLQRVCSIGRTRQQLEPDEHAELIRLSDQIEEANAERMGYLVELAKLREEPLKEVMEALGIKAGVNV